MLWHLILQHLEWITVLCSLLSIVLIGKQRIIAWPIVLLNIGASGILHFKEGLYGKCITYIFKALGSLYGWKKWAKFPQKRLKITRLTLQEASFFLVLSLIFFSCTSYLFHLLKNPFLYWDALFTTLMVGFYFLVSQKKLECWLFYLLPCLIYLPIYWQKGRYLLFLKLLAYLILSLHNFRKWHAEYTKSS